MNINKVSMIDFSGRIKKGQVAEKTQAALNEKKDGPLKKISKGIDESLYRIDAENMISSGAATTGFVIPAIFVVKSIGEKSV